MKTLNWIKKVGVVASLACASASAGVPDGYYRGGNSDKNEKAEVFIQHYNRFSADSDDRLILGIVILKNKAAVFKVEELENQTQVWTALGQSSDHLLSVPSEMEASYVVSVLKSGRRPKIVMTATDFGLRHGGHTLVLKYKRSKMLALLPEGGVNLQEYHTTNGFIKRGLLSGKFDLDGRSYRGAFQLKEIVPGVSLLRVKHISAEDADGLAQDEGITAVVVTIYHRRPILRNLYRAYIIGLPAGEVGEFKSYSTVRED